MTSDEKDVYGRRKQWMCPNCGNTMDPKLCLTHYKFCAMFVPPSQQPFREDD